MRGKFLALLVVISLTLSACNTSTPQVPTTAPEQQDPTTAPVSEVPPTEMAAPAAAPAESSMEPASLRFSSWGKPPQNEAVGGMVAAFAADYPSIAVSEEYDPYDGYFEKKTTQIAGAQLPDVFALDTGSICDYAKNGLIVDLSDTLKTGTQTGDMLAGLSPSAISNLAIDGKTYGFPMAGNVVIMYYNKDMFDAAGLEYPNPSWTFQDVMDAAQKLTLDKNGDGETDQYGYYPNVYAIDVLTTILHRFGARWLSPDGMTAVSDTPEAIAAIQFLQDLIYKDKVMPRPQDIQGIEYPFAAGMVAMYEDFAPFMADARDITDFQWDVTAMPLGFKGEQDNGPKLGNPNFVVSASSPNIPQAELLAAYMTTAKAQTILGQAQGRMPVQVDGLQAWAVTPPENIGVIAEILAGNADISEPLCSPNATEQYDAIYRALEGEILTNNTPAAEEMPKLTLEIQAIIDKK